MAIQLGNETVTLTATERTYSFQIVSEVGQEPIIVAHRERVLLRPDGSIVGLPDRSVPSVGREISAVKDKVIDGVSMTQLMSVIGDFVDEFRREDIAAKEAREKTAKAAEEAANASAAAVKAEEDERAAEAARKLAVALAQDRAAILRSAAGDAEGRES